jgi:hypothetical protein
MSADSSQARTDLERQQDGHAADSPEETPNGTAQAKGEDGEDKYAVTTLDEENDPKLMSTVRKWICLAVIGSSSLCAACASSVVRERGHWFLLVRTHRI